MPWEVPRGWYALFGVEVDGEAAMMRIGAESWKGVAAMMWSVGDHARQQVGGGRVER